MKYNKSLFIYQGTFITKRIIHIRRWISNHCYDVVWGVQTIDALTKSQWRLAHGWVIASNLFVWMPLFIHDLVSVQQNGSWNHTPNLVMYL